MTHFEFKENILSCGPKVKNGNNSFKWFLIHRRINLATYSLHISKAELCFYLMDLSLTYITKLVFNQNFAFNSFILCAFE